MSRRPRPRAVVLEQGPNGLRAVLLALAARAPFPGCDTLVAGAAGEYARRTGAEGTQWLLTAPELAPVRDAIRRALQGTP